MIVNKWVSIESVLSRLSQIIDPLYWNEVNVIEDCAWAASKIGAYNQFEKKIYHTTVTNHKAVLPIGLVQVDMIAYRVNKNLTTDDLEQIKRDVGISNENYYDGFLQSTYFGANYSPMRSSTSPFTGQYLCEDCSDIYIPGEHEYRIEPNGCITTSLKNGIICVAYLSVPMDDDGNILIPDDEDYIDALESYCLYRYWSKRWNMMEEGSERRYKEYQALWQTLKTKVSGKFNTPSSVDEYENIKNITNRLVPMDRRYYSFFGNLATPEYLRMKGFNYEE